VRRCGQARVLCGAPVESAHLRFGLGILVEEQHHRQSAFGGHRERRRRARGHIYGQVRQCPGGRDEAQCRPVVAGDIGYRAAQRCQQAVQRAGEPAVPDVGPAADDVEFDAGHTASDPQGEPSRRQVVEHVRLLRDVHRLVQ
jgi:hypothetical protein